MLAIGSIVWGGGGYPARRGVLERRPSLQAQVSRFRGLGHPHSRIRRRHPAVAEQGFLPKGPAPPHRPVCRRPSGGGRAAPCPWRHQKGLALSGRRGLRGVAGSRGQSLLRGAALGFSPKKAKGAGRFFKRPALLVRLEAASALGRSGFPRPPPACAQLLAI